MARGISVGLFAYARISGSRYIEELPYRQQGLCTVFVARLADSFLIQNHLLRIINKTVQLQCKYSAMMYS